MLDLLRRSALGALALLALGSAAQAQAQTQPAADPNRLFADSRLVVRDRFSDEIVGRGPDVVFIPGLASSRATWKATAERLRGRYRLHLIQVAGFSGEPARANASGDILIPTAEAIDAYLVSERLAPATVVGHSLGGTMALYLAEHHPEHLKKAMVVDALPFFGALQGPAVTAETIKPMAAQVRDMMAKGGPAYAANLQPVIKGMITSEADQKMGLGWGVSSDPSVVARAYYDDLTLDLRPGLSTIRTPIVLLYPDNAPNGAPAGATERVYPPLYAAAPSVKLKLVANSKHFIMLDQPQAFADDLDAFLAQP
ncbi:MAG: alpha/beta hydrolase [Phenylobacterium sp.]|nr:MAG: alpha/beta hydrolase [Phenylobacterium sp.]